MTTTLRNEWTRTRRGNWLRISVVDDRGRWHFYYYWRNLRVPWLAWAMFS